MKENKLLTFLGGLILFHIIWTIGSWSVQTKALPMPWEVYQNFHKVLNRGIEKHLLASTLRIFYGLGISVIIGLAVGLLMGSSKKINALLNPVVYFTYPIPKTALLPVLMILFGLGDGSKITLIVLITVFQMIVAVRDSVLQIDQCLYHTLLSLGATKYQMFHQVTLPAILPALLTNLRLSVGTALSVLFFAENYGTKYGLGYFIQDSWSRIDYLSMYNGILILSLLGFGLFICIDSFEKLFCKGK